MVRSQQSDIGRNTIKENNIVMFLTLTLTLIIKAFVNLRVSARREKDLKSPSYIVLACPFMHIRKFVNTGEGFLNANHHHLYIING